MKHPHAPNTLQIDREEVQFAMRSRTHAWLRDLGGALLRSPDTAVTRFRSRVAIQVTLRTGELAALSEFDATSFRAIGVVRKNDSD